ncbi:PTS system mannose/fructose/sorbose family IID component [Holdemania filiformis DSM 12042]|uniref:PTS system mannose/fructose/sorbose family IID component n=2 Tax=Holdemania filiformis TaxID=61171 RepID=B9Y2K2_9FIRM|nr:PTS system mannose/fructose/sorbose family IID component [Holdemania filiformis DSM 12042]
MQEVSEMSEKNEKLTKKELRKFSLRYAITAQASQSYEAMQGIACVYSMGPFFEKWFADDPELMQKKFQNNLKFFNCQTYFGAAITAAALAIEQDRDPSSLQLAASLKTSLMGPFSGIGDALFNTIPKVVMGAMTAYAAIEGNWITSIIMIAIFTPLITWVRQKMIEVGYYGGAELITSRKDQLNNIRDAVSVLGVIVIGALIPSLVKVTTPLAITVGDATQTIQSILDGILPALLPCLVTAITYFGLTKIKGMNTVKMVWILIVVTILLSYFGVIA